MGQGKLPLFDSFAHCFHPMPSRLLQLFALLLACAWLTPAHSQIRGRACETLNDMKTVRVGTICSTGTGAKFKRVKDASRALGWRDMQKGGRVWFDEVKVNAAQVEADAWCRSKPGQGVPSLDDFNLAMKDGFLDVVGSDFSEVKNPLLYSSKVAPMDAGDRAIGFSATRGDFNGVPPDGKFDNALIICVSLSSSP